MKVQLGCYECMMSRILRLARLITNDSLKCKNLADEMLGIFLAKRRTCTTPELSGEFNRVFVRETGNDDFFREQKRCSTELGLSLMDRFQNIVNESDNPFETALLLSVSGNVIDYGMNPNFDLNTAGQRILEVFSEPYDREAVCLLKQWMDKAKRIVYVLDNCGEAVIDRLLIERFPGKVTVATRGKPIFNDATAKDAEVSGITAPIIESGAALPGVSMYSCAPEFLDELNRADLVIAKGQGNFESLEDWFKGPIFFLMRVKCAVVSELVKAPVNSLQIIGRNLK